MFNSQKYTSPVKHPNNWSKFQSKSLFTKSPLLCQSQTETHRDATKTWNSTRCFPGKKLKSLPEMQLVQNLTPGQNPATHSRDRFPTQPCLHKITANITLTVWKFLGLTWHFVKGAAQSQSFHAALSMTFSRVQKHHSPAGQSCHPPSRASGVSLLAGKATSCKEEDGRIMKLMPLPS